MSYPGLLNLPRILVSSDPACYSRTPSGRTLSRNYSRNAKRIDTIFDEELARLSQALSREVEATTITFERALSASCRSNSSKDSKSRPSYSRSSIASTISVGSVGSDGHVFTESRGTYKDSTGATAGYRTRNVGNKSKTETYGEAEKISLMDTVVGAHCLLDFADEDRGAYGLVNESQESEDCFDEESEAGLRKTRANSCFRNRNWIPSRCLPDTS